MSDYNVVSDAALDEALSALVTASDTEAPQHAFELRLSVGGETWELTLKEMQRLVDEVYARGPLAGLQSGGGGTAANLLVATRDVSPEQYRAELDEWFQGRQRARREAIL